MADKASPFIEKPVKCPACRESHPQRYFRQRMFVADEKEADQHVVKYKWLSDTAAPVHPPFYALFYCPHCGFTDTSEDYASTTEQQLAVVRAYKDRTEKHEAVIGLLREHIDYETIDFESALNLHFLAILAQLLPAEASRDLYKVGRLLLRVAWLYRERTPDVAGNRSIPSVEDALKGLRPLGTALQEVRERWDAASQALVRRETELEHERGAAPEAYVAGRTRVEELFEALGSEIEKMKGTCRRDLGGTLDAGAGDDRPFHGFPSHEAFLAKLKGVFPLVPTTERDAMLSAIRYFDRAMSTDARFDSAQAQFGLVSLMADLYFRSGEFDAALQMVRGMYKHAADARLRYQRELRENKELDESGRRRITAQIRRANASLSQAGDLRRTLLDKLIDRDLPRIKELVAQNAGASPEQLETILTENGILTAVVARVKERGGVLGPASGGKRGH
ncbi:MAG: DUF2225 domain-containing protein [Candidatus Hydrogenedentes bacterium]|nr:DUF2225 domain-containing protein [Candidatus Hydrogenedentota bacterium]